jgi:hypothetical protein
MAETYLELTFMTVGHTAHELAVEQMRGMSDVKVVQSHKTQRGWLEASQLHTPEWDSRLVVRVHAPEDEVRYGESTGDVSHPYRTLEYEGTRTLQVPAPLLDLCESLEARYGSVRAARLRFETRAYEAMVLDGLVAQLEALGQDRARATFQRERDRLFGRIETSVEFVDDLAAHVQRSGLVDAERVRVEYY